MPDVWMHYHWLERPQEQTDLSEWLSSGFSTKNYEYLNSMLLGGNVFIGIVLVRNGKGFRVDVYWKYFLSTDMIFET